MLDDDPSTVVAIDADCRIQYVNRAWTLFAQTNGARWGAGEWGVGSLLSTAIPGVLRPFYDDLFQRARTSRDPVTHDYECSSPTTYRAFRMQLLPCDSGALLAVHSLLRATPLVLGVSAALSDETRYRSADGLIEQCSHCRRVRATAGRRHWEWVPELVGRSLPGTSHGLCGVCRAHYFTREGY